MLKKLKVKFIDPTYLWIAEQVIKLGVFLGRKFLGRKPCKIEWCTEKVKKNELYCARGHKQ